ncbi:FKBP-type peptidyl-prolyl cis-trans isomerase [Nocardioides sp. CFH 31398]|uniref:FKBP-type peptidyl-prolyl cis-trans isomerase n=1 Tax=Nocardioides sp. CFH 31398 TaxID=2919579 RepID=UPI001F0660F9|nr:FKBP-type peptidyl-prolyl cis-trans isomerase [Nocardioides sp. CFH 31398]MCH1866861.1 FKBP-type peptidyl-prolyl cis-trans isomerase [Nocardioides sp. CFH 31398]
MTALVLGLAACGEDESEGAEQTGAGLDSITISDNVGRAPEVEWDGRVAVDETESETIVEGDGPEIPADAGVMAQILIGNGYSENTVLSTWDSQPPTPQIFTPSGDLPAGIVRAFEGTTIGSRTAVVSPPEDAFGELGNPQLGIGNADSVLFVMDSVGVVQPSVSEEARTPPRGTPRVVEDESGAVTKLDFSNAAQPTGELEVTVLNEGNGPRVQADDFVAVTYLGQTFDGRQPFDQNFTAPKPDPNNPTAAPAEAGPAVFSLDGVVEGWKRGLTGIPTRSRVLLEIPPDLGYGEQGQPPDIQGDDTLYFVIDVLGTSTA